jgi:hypothetical protein
MPVLPVRMQTQEQSQWCYAAVVQAMADYYGIRLTQADIARKHPSTPCKVDPTGLNCPQDPYDLLAELGLAYGTDKYTQSTRSGAKLVKGIRESIDENAPLVALIGSGGQNHYVVIVGYSYDNGLYTYTVLDPITGNTPRTVGQVELFNQGFSTAFLDQNGVEHRGHNPLIGVVYMKPKPARGGRTRSRRRRTFRRRTQKK